MSYCKQHASEIADGKLPPAVWFAPGHWYPNGSYDPGAVLHIEVANARHARFTMVTPSKTVPGKIYTQYFADFEGISRVFENER